MGGAEPVNRGGTKPGGAFRRINTRERRETRAREKKN